MINNDQKILIPATKDNFNDIIDYLYDHGYVWVNENENGKLSHVYQNVTDYIMVNYNHTNNIYTSNEISRKKSYMHYKIHNIHDMKLIYPTDQNKQNRDKDLQDIRNWLYDE